MLTGDKLFQGEDVSDTLAEPAPKETPRGFTSALAWAVTTVATAFAASRRE